jgi:hypothetical protein
MNSAALFCGMIQAVALLGFDTEDGDMFLQNSGSLSLGYMALYPSRRNPSESPL